ncbi:Putative RNA-binding domain-containing protein [Desulfonema limicola]|uniref:RNA-binding domain-containing protein n=1 Tax=Desulfonema limicola TaxID=45656 RepID=A0A975B9L2_9BACT|nr:CooT family nickel-binding protein [Desulfonema limicola]QTA81367.1 Putative RNA-binding domain-containing protein [Desulfonema limicola]
MCDINVYVSSNGKEEIVLENVEQVKSKNHEISLINIFGEQRTFKADFIYYSNSEKKMVFELL